MDALNDAWTHSRLRRRLRLRRTLFFGLTLLSSLCASALLFDVLEANGLTSVEVIGLVLFFALFTWIAGSLWTAIAGFVIRLAGRDPLALDAAEVTGRPLRTHTAVVMAIYNEDPLRVEAGLDAIWSSLAREPEQRSFDLYILSDTTDAQIAAAEEAMWRRFVARYRGAERIFYRRRTDRSEHKAGNIADFVRRWGDSYECMIVLDADSVMTGATLVTLARLMEAHPEIGILQTLPLPAGRETLFGRVIQFGSRVQSPMLTSGLAFWHAGESNYWGHNAIVRVQPFARYCSLPRLSGKPPLGGNILSHDFVEAAFMRRAGFEVRQIAELGGSWEEVPANVLDFAKRDRRWTQGNLQHSRVLSFPGLHPLSRVHLLTGIIAYVSSPLWLALLLLSSIVSAIEASKRVQYFVPGSRSLFPNWPQIRYGETAVLLALTLVVLLLPKVLGAILVMRDKAQLRQYGGAARLVASLFVEQLFSVLLAPSMMLFHSTFVVQTLLGRAVAWNAQGRTDRGVTLREAFARQKWHLLLGVVWGGLMLRLAPQFFWWLTPVTVGLVCCVFVTAWTSRSSAGRRFRSWGLLLTPEETEPPRELAAALSGSPPLDILSAASELPEAASLAALAAQRKPSYRPPARTAAEHIEAGHGT